MFTKQAFAAMPPVSVVADAVVTAATSAYIILPLLVLLESFPVSVSGINLVSVIVAV